MSQESYVTHGDHVRLAGEIISVVGAVAMLLLEVSPRHVQDRSRTSRNFKSGL